jgi:hypothetical protein
VSETARANKCRVATNAGFFDPTPGPEFGRCFGNLVVGGRIIQDTGLQNANFGLLKNGSFVVGYLPMSLGDSSDTPFQTLVAGVGWIVRDGTNYVENSLQSEDGSSQKTGFAPYCAASCRAIANHY